MQEPARIGNLVKLRSRTNKGKNRLREAGTDLWKVLTLPQEVAFASGKWFLVAPVNGLDLAPIEDRHARWIQYPNDKNFEVFPVS